MKAVKIQVALFYDVLPKRADRFAAEISDGYDGQFDKMPIILPEPEGLPQDIPLVIQQSSTSSNQITVARGRCDLVIAPQESDEVELKNFIADRRMMILHFVKKVLDAKTVVKRIGIILTAYNPEENPIRAIAQNTKIKYSDADEMNIRINQREEKNGVLYNQVREFTATEIQNAQGEKKPVVGFTYDINTAPEIENVLDEDKIQKAIKFALDQFVVCDADVFQ